MIMITIDDEPLAVEGCINAIHKVNENYEVHGFCSGSTALEFAEKNKPDVVFLDVEMRTMDGIEVAKKLQVINPNINIIFVTGYSEYMKEAFDIYASGYILKPVTEKKVRSELEHLRHPVKSSGRYAFRIRTFGNFEVFDMAGIPIDFSYNRTKELLAVLIDADGAMKTFGQIMDYLWMDEDDAGTHSSYLRNLFADMQRVFLDHNCSEALIRRRGAAGVNREYFLCDYFEFLNGNRREHPFSGEYMTQYSWAEMTLGRLVSMSDMSH